MIRLGMPIRRSDGQLKGVIVMNYMAKDFLDLFKRYDQTTIGHIMLLNEKGYYLSSYRENQEWGFMFPDKQDVNFAVDHPKEWANILQGSHYVLSDDGMFTALHINPQALYLQKISNQNLPQTVYSQDSWYIVSWIPKDYSNAFLYYNDIGHLFTNVATQMIFPILFILTLIVAYIASLGFRYYQKINHRADFDTLTQAHSREGGMVRLQALFHAAKVSRFTFSLCFTDVNGLKEINDHLGHAYGDEMITTAITIIRSEIRQNDFVIRFGGDEFIIILPYIDAAHAESVWKRITDKMATLNEQENRPYLISLSHGIIDNQVQDSVSLDEMISLADQKMYSEKQIIKKNFSSLRNTAKD
jgi:diguanylate cyclase (GGDEF)-like protein